MNELKELIFPDVNGKMVKVNFAQSILFIGANGSGKTRLASWLNNQDEYKEIIHRISAQRVLKFPEKTQLSSMELAEQALWNGMEGFSSFHRGNPAVYFQDDFAKLVNYLFSDEVEENAKYRRASQSSTNRIEPKLTKIDQIKKLWEEVLPHRELRVDGLHIQTIIKGQPDDKAYKASEMSDGERVIFYLIGQCLSTPKDGIILIDEPELHLHKSIQIPLWNEIEKLRSDCTFVYLTHDVDFASSKENSKKIWLKSFDGQQWDWKEIVEDNSLPNELLIEILGSRKPIVFVEGENGSYDVSLYREILADFLVIPRGSCTQVMQSVKALKLNNQLHHLEVYGLIDRDRRPQHEITILEQSSIFVLNVAEVENLFCTQEVLEVVSNRLGRDSAQDFLNASTTIFSRLQNELETQVSLHVSNEVKFKLNMFDSNKKGILEITNTLNSLLESIDIDRLYTDTEAIFKEVVQEKNYAKLLALYNRKSLSSQVSSALGLANGTLPETIVRLARSDCKEQVKAALKPYFGSFQQYIM